MLRHECFIKWNGEQSHTHPEVESSRDDSQTSSPNTDHEAISLAHPTSKSGPTGAWKQLRVSQIK